MEGDDDIETKRIQTVLLKAAMVIKWAWNVKYWNSNINDNEKKY